MHFIFGICVWFSFWICSLRSPSSTSSSCLSFWSSKKVFQVLVQIKMEDSQPHAIVSPCAATPIAPTATTTTSLAGVVGGSVASVIATSAFSSITTAATTTTTTTISTVTTPTATSTNSSNTCSTNISSCTNNNNTGSGNAASIVQSVCLATNLAAQLQHQQQQQQQQTALLSTTTTTDICKIEDVNNLSMASGLSSDCQRSHSGAPSASSSPILSPQGKIFGRNANGTIVATSRPSNEAEVQLYRVLQRASLLAYYDTLLEMGGDDVQQLYDAGEEEFLEIMALVGMASKPLHVRRLQKALHEWANNPSLFQGHIMPNTSGLCDTPTKASIVFNAEANQALSRNKFPAFTPGTTFHPTPLISTAHNSPVSVTPTASTSSSSTVSVSAHLLTQICAPTLSVPVIQPLANTSLVLTPNPLPPNPNPLQAGSSAAHSSGGVGIAVAGTSGSTSHQVSSSSPQLTPVLTEVQVQRITHGAEKIARQLPQREPRAQTTRKRTTRELEQVIAMSEHDPRRMDEIRKYSAIYGRFDCKRRPEKPLTLHEVCVNEAAAQLCRLVPALLMRRDELFPLARQIVKDAGFGHSASIARYGGLLAQMQTPNAPRSANVTIIDCESSEPSSLPLKRQRLCSTETSSSSTATAAPVDLNRDALEDSRYNLFAMYQKFAKPPFDLSEIAKFSLGKAEFDDNDNDSRFSFSNSSSPPMPSNGTESERDSRYSIVAEASNSATSFVYQNQSAPQLYANNNHKPADSVELVETIDLSTASSPLSGVQVISAAGGNIIAVANPALALSPTLGDVMSLKRDVSSPEIQ